MAHKLLEPGARPVKSVLPTIKRDFVNIRQKIDPYRIGKLISWYWRTVNNIKSGLIGIHDNNQGGPTSYH